MRSIICVFTIIFLMPTASQAKCKAKIVAPAVAMQTSEAVMKPGEEWVPPTQIVEKKDKSRWICAHGDYCYDAKAIKLIGCRIDKKGEKSGEDIYFSIH